MKRKLLFAALCAVMCALGGQLRAQGWTASSPATGDFYLYNVGANAYLTDGSSWGTHAALNSSGFVLNITEGDGVYTLGTNSKYSGKFFTDNGYVDTANSTNWIFEPVAGLTNTYKLKTEGGSYAYAAAGMYNVEIGTDPGTNKAYWKLVTAANRDDVTNATNLTPVELTHKITNPRFDDNNTGWEDAPERGGNTGGTNNNVPSFDDRNPCAEHYNKTYDTYQELSGLTNGTYAVSVQGFYREGGYTAAATAHTAGTESLNAILYANSEEQPLMSIFEEAGKASGGSTKTADGISGAFPDNMSAASYFFSAGLYWNTVYVSVTDGTLKLGIKKSTAVGADWTIFDNFRLQYFGSCTIAEAKNGTLIVAYNEALAAAQSLASLAMTATAKATLNGVIDANDDLDTSSATAEELTAATTALNDAVTAAQPSVDLYASIKTLLDGLKTQDASFDGDTKYNAGTYTDISEVYSEYYAYAIDKLGTAANTDFTAAIVNPGFEFGNTLGWTYSPSNDHGAKSTSDDTYKMTNSEGSYLFNIWSAGHPITQTIPGLPNGTYELTAVVANSGADETPAKVYLLANDVHEGITCNIDASIGVEGSVRVVIADGNLTIGAVGSNNDADRSYSADGVWWYKVDNFRLTYLGNLVSEEDAEAILANVPEGVMKGSVQTALTAAVEAFESEKTTVNYVALETAIANANASITAYATAKTAIDKANAIKAANNFVTSAAAETFAEAIAAISDAYDEGTLSDSDASAAGTTLGTAVSGWHANPDGAAGVYMQSAWTNIGFDQGYYINTWSTEGDNDGSGFSVPFFEYWTGSGSLAAKTMTATLDGLTAGQLYKLSADVRVQYSSKVDGSITLTVGDGTAVDVTAGTQIGTSDRYLSTFNAFGKADEDGKLTLTISVAAESGISWLSWQNVSYEETNLDFTALNTAIAAANAVNAKVTNGVASLATAITTAQGLLTSATTQEEVAAGVTTLNSAISAAETIIAARLKLAGTVKKATALKSYLDDNIDTEISTATEYVSNADATAAEATNKTNALNAHFSSWTTVSLTNANFDTNINIAADGTNSGTASSIDKNTGNKITLYDQTGWTSISKHASTAAHSASAVYGAASASTNGTNSTNAPAADMYGATEGGVLQISAGWADQARYEQAIASLPAGKYVFYYEAFNANSGAAGIVGNYFGIGDLTAGDLQGSNNTFKYSDTKSYTYNTWVVDAFEFDLGKDVTTSKVKIGVQGTDSSQGSGAAAKLWIDNVTIYRIGNADVTVSEEQTSAFVATEANVTLTRTLKGGQWNGFSVPFDFTISGSALDGAEVKEFDSADDNVITLTDATEIVAGKPYLVKPESDIENPTFEGVDVENPEETVEGTGDYTFQAHLYATDLATDGSVAYVSTTDSSIKKLTSGSIKGLRAIFNIPTGAGVKALVLNLGGADGVQTVDAAGNITAGEIYNIAGQRMCKPQKGVNIINGKKVLVK